MKSGPSTEENQASPEVQSDLPGFVSSSELLRTLAQLQQTEHTLRQEINDQRAAAAELATANIVFQTTSQGIMVCDGGNRIVMVNPAMTEITGYPAEEVIGENPSIFSSGRHGPAFYETMWQALITQGRWSGEIWNRRKNGEIFPEWLSITQVLDRDGNIYRRVGVFTDISHYKRAEETILYQANYDPLTHLPNRRLFMDRLDLDLKKARRENTSVALFFLDLDNFKEINDSQGHDVGDELLAQVADRLSRDMRQTDTVCRLGGDEFTIIMTEVDSAHAVDILADRIAQAFQEPFDLAGGFRTHISASIGITLYPADADTSGDLLKQADQAMYEAKKLGRNRYCYFTASLQEASLARTALSGQLREAVAEKQFEMHYQPVLDISGHGVAKAEALIRWHHPSMGMVPPAYFIPRAEESGLIEPIGQLAFEQAIRCAGELNSGGRALTFSVNLSPRQFAERRAFANWAALAAEFRVPTERIVLEITEGLLLDEREDVRRHLETLRRSGFRFAIDNFGIGYSALSCLKKFKFDFLKIDRSFIRDLQRSADDRALVEAMVVMAHRLGIQVIAEGVETKAQHQLLQEAGCDLVQGHLFSPSLPRAQFQEYLKQC